MIQITKNNFDDFINRDFALVKFGARWCNPCKQVTPILTELCDEYEGKVEFGDIDVEMETDLALKFNIRSVPSIMVFKKGQLADEIKDRSKNDIKSKIDNLLAT